MHDKRTDATIYEEKNKNNSSYTKLIPAQEKIFTLCTKIIHGSLINLTYIKIIPDIDGINYRQPKK